jgi:hypothetical protein
MKFYLSNPPNDSLPGNSISVKVNNISRRREKIKQEYPIVKIPDESLIEKLNALASKPPFCVIYKVKKYDML